MRRVAALCALLVTLAAAVTSEGADAPWLLVKGENLTVLGQQSAAELRATAVLLEQFRAAIAMVLPSARHLAVPTNVFVFDTPKALRSFVPFYKGRPVDVAGYFQGHADANYIAVGSPDSRAAILHEYAHMLQRNASASIPLWLNEGLAEYFSTFRLKDNERRAEIGRAVDAHVALLRERALPMMDLLGATRQSALYNEGDRRSIFYAQAWATVHYVMAEVPDAPEAINSYLTRLQRGDTGPAAFAQAFGDPSELGRRVRDYVRRFAFRSWQYDFPAPIAVQPPIVSRAVDGGELDARLGDLLLRVQRVDEAAARIESAVAQHPPAAHAYLALGQLRADQNRDRESIDALRRAASMDRNDFASQYAYGVALLSHDADARALGIADPLAAARESLQRAIALNADASDALAWLSAAWARASDWDRARTALEQAVSLAPGRLDFALRLADLDLIQGRLADAKARLATIAAADPSSTIARTAGGRLAELSRN